jgi:hypothetical protein
MSRSSGPLPGQRGRLAIVTLPERFRAGVDHLLGSRAGAWVVGGGLIIWALVAVGAWVLMYIVGVQIEPALLVVASVALGLLLRLLPAAEDVARHGPAAVEPDVADGTHNFDTAGLSWWERRLEWVDGDPEAFNMTIHPRVVAIVDERLRLKHGVSRVDDPQRSRKILGEALWELLDPPPATAPTPRGLREIITQIERL